jgi:hypothetical protein
MYSRLEYTQFPPMVRYHKYPLIQAISGVRTVRVTYRSELTLQNGEGKFNLPLTVQVENFGLSVLVDVPTKAGKPVMSDTSGEFRGTVFSQDARMDTRYHYSFYSNNYKLTQGITFKQSNVGSQVTIIEKEAEQQFFAVSDFPNIATTGVTPNKLLPIK